MTGNSARTGGGASGVLGASVLNNCIVYFNTAADEANYSPDYAILNYSCTTPLPTNGVGNITNAPLFVDAAAGNYRLRPGSPCIDAGTNLSAILTTDLDGRPRPVDGNGDGLAAFDIGAYEYRALLVWQGSPSPTPPYATWATAATNIQDAVDAALPGDEIVVTNGTYATGGRTVGTNVLANRVAVDKPLTLRSVNGPEFTIIQGRQVPGTTNGDGAVRCVFLASGASLSGFTLTNGATRTFESYTPDGYGGGVWCESVSAVVSNCTLAGNSASAAGGGALGGTLNNCTLTADSTPGGGWLGGGGGAYGSTLNHCTLTGNSAYSGGGAAGCTLNNCMLTGNSASSYGGGASDGVELPCTLSNCTLTGNSASSGGGAAGCTLNNCTLTGNSADYGGGVDCVPLGLGSRLNNCIVYFNTARVEPNYAVARLNYCCTTPLPTYGVGNITNEPAFVDYAGGNLRLQSNSPCINAGRNAYAPGPADLDGLPRIVRGTVDIGAYEFQGPGSVISYAWLQRYGLPTDGSADATDPDADGHTTWQEWRCLTDPTNALSVLRLLSATPDGSDVTLTWQSVSGVNYFLERSTDLSATPPFSLLATDLPGQPGTNAYTDTNAVGAGPFFYRVGVGN